MHEIVQLRAIAVGGDDLPVPLHPSLLTDLTFLQGVGGFGSPYSGDLIRSGATIALSTMHPTPSALRHLHLQPRHSRALERAS